MKMERYKAASRGFASLIGLLITIMIIAVLYYLSINTTSKSSFSDTKSSTSNPKSVLDNARNTVNDINQRQSESLVE
ncbi:MAG: hypothetical protein KAS13_05670 [Candidatus Omnitrophica bacterium]|nr:hypothetical protein [Candidatus Omnitrophota bacterium]